MKQAHGRLILFAIMVLVIVAEVRGVGCSALRDVVDDAADGVFRVLGHSELHEHELLFRDFLLEKPTLEERARTLGFSLRRPIPGVIALVEDEEHRWGRGVFLSRPAASSSLVVQAPHRFFDRDTDIIARLFFEEGEFRVAAWNTVPRWSAGGGIRGAADSQATTASTFVAFARALQHSLPTTTIVQIHGFAPENRSTPEGRRAGLIVSQGISVPTSWFNLFAAALTIRFPGSVACFPRRVEELGALGNTTASTLREFGSDRFVHLELSPEWRQRFIHERQQRIHVLSALRRYADQASVD